MPQPEADGERRVDLGHAGVIQPPHALLQPPFINGSYLLQQNDRVPHKAAVAAGHVDVRGQAGLIVLAGDGRAEVRVVVTAGPNGVTVEIAPDDAWAPLVSWALMQALDTVLHP